MRTLSPYLLPALKVAGIYACVGGLWILFSDAALEAMVPDPATQAALQTWKGWFYVLVTAALLFVLVLRQLHSSAKAARALRLQRETFHAVFEALPVAVHGYDRNYQVLFWNQACTEAYGYEAPEALGRPMVELVLPVPGLCDKLSAKAEGERAMRCGVLTIIRKDGTLARVHSTRLTLPLPGGRQFYFLDIPLSEDARAEPPRSQVF